MQEIKIILRDMLQQQTSTEEKFAVYKQLRTAINPGPDYALINITFPHLVEHEYQLDDFYAGVEANGFEIICIKYVYESEMIFHGKSNWPIQYSQYFVLVRSQEEENLFKVMYKTYPENILSFKKKHRKRMLAILGE